MAETQASPSPSPTREHSPREVSTSPSPPAPPEIRKPAPLVVPEGEAPEDAGPGPSSPSPFKKAATAAKLRAGAEKGKPKPAGRAPVEKKAPVTLVDIYKIKKTPSFKRNSPPDAPVGSLARHGSASAPEDPVTAKYSVYAEHPTAPHPSFHPGQKRASSETPGPHRTRSGASTEDGSPPEATPKRGSSEGHPEGSRSSDGGHARDQVAKARGSAPAAAAYQQVPPSPKATAGKTLAGALGKGVTGKKGPASGLGQERMPSPRVHLPKLQLPEELLSPPSASGSPPQGSVTEPAGTKVPKWDALKSASGRAAVAQFGGFGSYGEAVPARVSFEPLEVEDALAALASSVQAPVLTQSLSRPRTPTTLRGALKSADSTRQFSPAGSSEFRPGSEPAAAAPAAAAPPPVTKSLSRPRTPTAGALRGVLKTVDSIRPVRGPSGVTPDAAAAAAAAATADGAPAVRPGSPVALSRLRWGEATSAAVNPPMAAAPAAKATPAPPATSLWGKLKSEGKPQGSQRWDRVPSESSLSAVAGEEEASPRPASPVNLGASLGSSQRAKLRWGMAAGSGAEGADDSSPSAAAAAGGAGGDRPGSSEGGQRARMRWGMGSKGGTSEGGSEAGSAPPEGEASDPAGAELGVGVQLGMTRDAWKNHRSSMRRSVRVSKTYVGSVLCS